MGSPWFRDLSDLDVWLSDEWNEWDWAAKDHPGFRQAFEALVEKGCDGWALLDIFERIRELDDGEEARASPNDLRRIRAVLDQGRHTLRGLVEGPLLTAELMSMDKGPVREVLEEWRLLHFSRDDADAALRILRDLSDQLKRLQRGADRRRNRVRDQHRAILVRYVKRTTGRLHDRRICHLLEVALAPQPYIHKHRGDEVWVDPDHTWAEMTVEAHRRWRSRNKRLIDKPPGLEAQWEKDVRRKAEERNAPKPQRLRTARYRPKKR